METVRGFIFLGSKITADGDCSHEIKRCFAPWKKSYPEGWNGEGGGRGKTEDEMVGWHHQLDGHESEQAPGVGAGQGGLVCCSPWARGESDMTERLN